MLIVKQEAKSYMNATEPKMRLQSPL